jgi:hypothetical protein
MNLRLFFAHLRANPLQQNQKTAIQYRSDSGPQIDIRFDVERLLTFFPPLLRFSLDTCAA